MKTLFTLASVLIVSLACAQDNSVAADTIFKKNKEVLLVKITEIGLDEVKYKPIVNPNNVVLVIEKTEISKIVFANGLVQTFADPLKDKSVYADNHRNNLKFNFLSPMGDRAHFNWEHSIKPGMSYEVGLNFIGLGKRYGIYTPMGATVNAGFRLYRMPDMKSRSDRYTHVMNGSYIQPTFVFGMTSNSYRRYNDNYSYPYNSSYTIAKENTSYFMFFLNFGKQFIFANRISFDMNFGIGYGTYTNQNRLVDFYYYNDYSEGSHNTVEYPSHYGFLIGAKERPIAFNAQLKIGYLLR